MFVTPPESNPASTTEVTSQVRPPQVTEENRNILSLDFFILNTLNKHTVTPFHSSLLWLNFAASGARLGGRGKLKGRRWIRFGWLKLIEPEHEQNKSLPGWAQVWNSQVFPSVSHAVDFMMSANVSHN